MDWSRLFRSIGARDDDAAVLSRREALAGMGLVGLFGLAGPPLLGSAEAKPLDAPAAGAAAKSSDAPESDLTGQESAERGADDTADVTDLTAHRRWRRRYWRRRHWRHRYWRRRRHWHRRHWHRRHWRRRYWRRRYYW